jgi:small subunit ribosomal protein S9
MTQDFFYGTGKRKTSIARTRLYNGSGQIIVNGRPFNEYFPRASLQMIIKQPLELTKTVGKFDIKVMLRVVVCQDRLRRSSMA